MYFIFIDYAKFRYGNINAAVNKMMENGKIKFYI